MQTINIHINKAINYYILLFFFFLLLILRGNKRKAAAAAVPTNKYTFAEFGNGRGRNKSIVDVVAAVVVVAQQQ